MPITPRPIPHPTQVEEESQECLNYVLAEIQRVHPGATVAQHPELAIEALCVLLGGAMAKCKALEDRLYMWVDFGQPQ